MKSILDQLLIIFTVTLTAGAVTEYPPTFRTGRINQFAGFATPRPAPAPVDGPYVYGSIWASWSAWSFCINNVRVRVRACNTVRGFSCLGNNQEYMECEKFKLEPSVPDSEYEAVDPWEDDRNEAIKQLYPDTIIADNPKKAGVYERFKITNNQIRRHPQSKTNRLNTTQVEPISASKQNDTINHETDKLQSIDLVKSIDAEKIRRNDSIDHSTANGTAESSSEDRSTGTTPTTVEPIENRPSSGATLETSDVKVAEVSDSGDRNGNSSASTAVSTVESTQTPSTNGVSELSLGQNTTTRLPDESDPDRKDSKVLTVVSQNVLSLDSDSESQQLELQTLPVMEASIVTQITIDSLSTVSPYSSKTTTDSPTIATDNSRTTMDSPTTTTGSPTTTTGSPTTTTDSPTTTTGSPTTTMGSPTTTTDSPTTTMGSPTTTMGSPTTTRISMKGISMSKQWNNMVDSGFVASKIPLQQTVLGARTGARRGSLHSGEVIFSNEIQEGESDTAMALNMLLSKLSDEKTASGNRSTTVLRSNIPFGDSTSDEQRSNQQPTSRQKSSKMIAVSRLHGEKTRVGMIEPKNMARTTINPRFNSKKEAHNAGASLPITASGETVDDIKQEIIKLKETLKQMKGIIESRNDKDAAIQKAMNLNLVPRGPITPASVTMQPIVIDDSNMLMVAGSVTTTSEWSEWSDWKQCFCNRQLRTRTCKYDNAYLTSGCQGKSYESRPCESSDDCPTTTTPTIQIVSSTTSSSTFRPNVLAVAVKKIDHQLFPLTA